MKSVLKYYEEQIAVRGGEICPDNPTPEEARYTTVVGDGDAKTHSRLTSINVCGDEHAIKKEECINHVEKRIGTALCNARQASHKHGISLGGRGFGKLTDTTLKRLAWDYGKAM